ncbi:MAG: nucleoside kinase [Bacteroidaceae bacterium]|nr:nucleoside kinase [Bacteroidaceae bacterium]
MVKIRCKNTNCFVNVEEGTTLFEFFQQIKSEIGFEPICARVNNRITPLDMRIYRNLDVEFLPYREGSASRTYSRTLFFILAKAVHDLYPKGMMTVNNPVSNGYYCTVDTGNSPLEPTDIEKIKQRIQAIIDADLKIVRHESPTEDAIEKFTNLGMESKVKLLRYTGRIYTSYHEIDGYYDYYYGALLPRTSMVHLFDLIEYHNGLLLRIPDRKNCKELSPLIRQDKMYNVFQEHQTWLKTIGLKTIGDLNHAMSKGYSTNLINVAEALQEKKISQIAEDIASRKDVKIVLLAGPSSSGKTSTCKRISVQLITCGKWPLPISMDDYFVDRDKTPLQPNGDYDYESLYALNLERFNNDLNALLQGKTIRPPKYNFMKGKSEESGTELSMRKDCILVIEGIHALNPELTSAIDDKYIYRVYASALTSIRLDEHNYIPTTDNRLLRRIVRDAKTRGVDARESIRRWPSVREGEDKWIFPYQENADAMFNTAMFFELAALKSQAVPMLEHVPENCPEYCEAYRLLKFLSYIPSIPDDHIPPTSLLREFLGGSSLVY